MKTKIMTQWEYQAKPPYPIKKRNYDEYFQLGVCWLRIRDNSKKINFRDDLLWFEVNYADGAKTLGSIRAYMGSSKVYDKNIFAFIVEYYCPFKMTIYSPDGFNLLRLSTKFLKQNKL